MKSMTITLIAIAIFTGGHIMAAQEPPRPVGQQAAPARQTVTRVYDVRDLLAPTYDFPLNSSAYASAFISPSGQPLQAGGQGGTGGAGVPVVTNHLFGPGGPVMNQPNGPEPTDPLLKLVLDSIDRESWTDMGGAVGQIHLLNGQLVITQTEQNHHKIAELLADLSREQGGMVRVKADWVLVPSSEVGSILKAPEKSGAEEAIRQIDPQVLSNLPAGAKHFTAQTLSRSGQTVYVISGLDRQMVTSTTPVVSTGVAAYSADISNVGGGIALEVNSRVNWDQQMATVTLYSTFSDPARPKDQNIVIATTQPGANMGEHATLKAGFQPFSRVVQDMRTTVRVPLGTSVLVGGMTLQPSTSGGDEQQLMLVIKVSASR